VLAFSFKREEVGEDAWPIPMEQILFSLLSLHVEGLAYFSAAVKLSSAGFFTKLGGIWNILLTS